MYDFGVSPDGVLFYVMELLHGVDLETLVSRFGPLPSERVVHLLLQACDSLDDAHRRGLIHRDIKPANRADIYALGCVGYWLLTGQLVFDAGTTVGMLTAHVISQPAPPSQRVDLPIAPELERVVLECLQKDPAQRPASAEALREALGRVPLSEPWSRERATAWWSEHVPARRSVSASSAP